MAGPLTSIFCSSVSLDPYSNQIILLFCSTETYAHIHKQVPGVPGCSKAFPGAGTFRAGSDSCDA